MPWKIEKRDGQHCVIKTTDGSVEKCHDGLQDAKDHMSALYASEEKSLNVIERMAAFLDYLKGGLAEKGAVGSSAPEGDAVGGAAPKNILFTKQNGLWHWFGAVSNNIYDEEDQVIKESAHRRFVKAVDDGTYQALFGHEMPEFWVWHIGVPVGDARMVAFDDRGYLLGAGVQREGEFYDRVFEKLAAWAAENPDDVAMSHGAPKDFLEWEKEGEIVSGYLDKEFTILPKLGAANRHTVAGVSVMKKEGPMQIPDHKRKWFMNTFGDEIVKQFDEKLSEMSAETADLPRKERSAMSEETQEKEAQAEEVNAEEKETQVSAEQGHETQEAEEVTKAMTEEEQEEEDEEEEMDKETEKKETRHVTVEELTEVVSEITKGIKEGIAEAMGPIQQQQQKLVRDVAELQKEIGTMSQTRQEQIAKTAQDTPIASLSEMITKSITESAGAKVTKEDNLSGPEEAEAEMQGPTGIPALNEQIMKQRRQGKRRVWNGARFAGQDQ